MREALYFDQNSLFYLRIEGERELCFADSCTPAENLFEDQDPTGQTLRTSSRSCFYS